MANDCERIFEASLYLHYMWASPLYVVVVVGLVTARVGWAALVGFGLLMVVIPIQARLGKTVGAAKRSMMPATDARTDLVAQILAGIEVIKAYCWDADFVGRLGDARRSELSSLATIQLVRGLMRWTLFIVWVLPTPVFPSPSSLLRHITYPHVHFDIHKAAQFLLTNPELLRAHPRRPGRHWCRSSRLRSTPQLEMSLRSK